MTATFFELPAVAAEALLQARDDLRTQIDDLDTREIDARDALDVILGTRTRYKAALTDLDNLLAAHLQADPPSEPSEPAAPPPAAQPPTAAHVAGTTATGSGSSTVTTTVAMAKRPSRAGVAGKGGRPAKDYTEIADWINQAKANGKYSQEALAGRFGVSISTAKNWFTRCRQLGLLNQPPRPAPAAKPTGADDLQRQVVPATTVSDFKPGEQHLECADCDAVFHVHQTSDLLTHTLREHGRTPRKSERTPKAAA